MARIQKKKPMKKSKRKSIFKILAFCIGVIALAVFIKVEIDIFAEVSKNKKELEEKTEQYKQIELTKEEKEQIKESIASGNVNDEKILKMIRNRGYAFPDEKVYIDITGN